ncbi:hypothetical protein [Salinibacillus xinjiangensis]|uniref:TolB domain-containing protein n=1 Tax=Salinibacillus xinjiangensis TaxID=1229268 RepID=A0A6G1X5E7_9BACI|nr:hypothetical protein [Salinibacillus xinjiangensis]MRG86126.1 hypothetical protein [Salinibacillus xinjiangensis]
MLRIFNLTMISVILFPISVLANEALPSEDVHVAFIQDGNLWLWSEQGETQITKSGGVYDPQWSFDGEWILYQKAIETEKRTDHNEIWVYNRKSGEHKKIFYNGRLPKWAPTQNLIAFQSEEVLNVSDLERFHNVALGVNGYTWLPDGSGFLLSSQADLVPIGWTNPKLYRKSLPENINKVEIFKDVKEFFTIPNELGIGDDTIWAITAGGLQFSPSGKWISFVVSPTASMSMDTNMLSVISSNGKRFEVLDEIIFEVGKPKWAPEKDMLAYIAGQGRIVFGFKDKNLKVKEMPVSESLTPKNYAELDFTWVDDNKIVTSRIEEREWSNNAKEHPLPALYSIQLEGNKQRRITDPPEDYGDYAPQYLLNAQKLIWFRQQSLTERNKDLWIGDANGKNAHVWLKNVEDVSVYEIK